MKKYIAKFVSVYMPRQQIKVEHQKPAVLHQHIEIPNGRGIGLSWGFNTSHRPAVHVSLVVDILGRLGCTIHLSTTFSF